MVAVAEIEVKNRVFKPGETVTGLSEADKKWMLEKGYIKEPEKKQKPKGNANEL